MIFLLIIPLGLIVFFQDEINDWFWNKILQRRLRKLEKNKDK